MNRSSVFAEVFFDGAAGQNIKLTVVAASYFKVRQGQSVFGNSEVCLDYVPSCRYGRPFALTLCVYDLWRVAGCVTIHREIKCMRTSKR